MTIQERKVMKLALEALEDIANETYGSWTNGEKAQRIAQNLIPTIKEALAQPQQEPVAIPRFGLNPDNGMMYESKRGPWCLFKDIPPQRTWVGLTDEERKDIELGIEVFDMSVEDILKEAEANLKEKNT